ncbi:lipid-A-disaccharide synthase [Filimonas lacunae]|uniref:Lipid-A-disaccharide synthase n=1 Tax=Filimonas lacunae TaxID=477680 RepID=A0A173MAI5_9BACT|nr:lipid-A-disaccharide synthase [Filimonas lacunae]BAV04563.1 lipid-A-disaccharide synthase [Filimonas lacunae]SIT34779.1 lipid-A-disaccharide synthase [Filimonas lacunae]
MKYYIIAGEASGDLHGSNLVKEILQLQPATKVRGWGGDLMQAAGVTLVKHYRELAFMGFVEVIMNLRTILRNLSFCKEDILQYKPDVIVLVDYPGFNLRIAEWAKEQGIKVIYYISPQVWAWKENRVKKMKTCIDKMLVILPFEKDYFRDKWNWEVEYVGHPLVKVIDNVTDSSAVPTSPLPTIALLPGSRKQEILKKLPIMLEVTKRFPNHRFVVAMAPGQEDSFYSSLLQPYSNVTAVRNQTYALLKQSVAALVTSGTATLETALFKVPEIVCYKGSNISYQIAKRLIKVKYISLVNLIMDKMVVKELIQHDLTPGNLTEELTKLLNDPLRKEQLKQDYGQLHELLSAGGNASANAAKSIVEFMG